MLDSIDPNDLMPLEVDDEFIFKNEVAAPETPGPCLVTGFIHHSRVFLAAIRDLIPNRLQKNPVPVSGPMISIFKCTISKGV